MGMHAVSLYRLLYIQIQNMFLNNYCAHDLEIHVL